MSGKDRPHWRVVSNVGGDLSVSLHIRCSGEDGPKPAAAWYFKDRFEPVLGLGKSAKVEVTSTPLGVTSFRFPIVPPRDTAWRTGELLKNLYPGVQHPHNGERSFNFGDESVGRHTIY